MIKAFLAPYLGWIYSGLAIAAAVGAIWVYNGIYDRGYDAASAKFEKAAIAQKAANDLAIDKAKSVLTSELTNLIIQKERLEADVERLSAQAAKDPDAASGGIKRSSVQRVNSVR